MMNIRNWLVVNPATYFLVLTFLFTGLFKNILLIYLIVIVHEFGHIWIIKRLGFKILRVEIYPLGGVTVVDKRINTPVKRELLIASMGIVFQIGLGLVFRWLFSRGVVSLNTYELFLGYNRAIMVFNCLPIMPLDGYVFLRGLLELIWPYKKAFYGSIFFSIGVLVLFGIFNQVYAFNNYLILGFLSYKIICSWREFKYIYERFLVERYIYNVHYSKVKYDKKVDLGLLRKETLHYFRWQDTYLGEKKVLRQKFEDSSLL